ncbi:hypothetical protein T484DRAFT_1827712 [Baffinella frigidus]|nr:hypothetical protein T484DRAFT_1827712 [Cryptophyta sp. CCMP2293]
MLHDAPTSIAQTYMLADAPTSIAQVKRLLEKELGKMTGVPNASRGKESAAAAVLPVSTLVAVDRGTVSALPLASSTDPTQWNKEFPTAFLDAPVRHGRLEVFPTAFLDAPVRHGTLEVFPTAFLDVPVRHGRVEVVMRIAKMGNAPMRVGAAFP